MKLVYNVNDKPPVSKLIISAFQQLLAILAATIAVPAIINGGMPEGLDAQMSSSAALFGAGVGTLVYQLFTRFKSPVFLGSSFAFLGSMAAAFAGAATASIGFLGLILGAILAGLVYVILAVIVKKVGVEWINKMMPPVVIGPTVAIIGLSLASNAVCDAVGRMAQDASGNFIMTTSGILSLICALVTLLTIILCSVFGKKSVRLFPFVIGILAGYAVATYFTWIGFATGNTAMQLIDFSQFYNMKWYPEFTFIEAFFSVPLDFGEGSFWSYFGTIAVAYVPVAFVVFAEHIADHKNLSSIIEKDLLSDPGLSNTLLGDGVGSIVGAIFGGCPNTTYGESVGCVAITGNASVRSITLTAFIAILSSFVAPFVTFLATIPPCVMGGVCIALYGFIACSGLKMIQKVDLNDNANLFVVCVILICGVGGLSLSFGKITITAVACSLILGIIINSLLSAGKHKSNQDELSKNE
ncbi:MAG: uracil-xanthine permease [Clostridia bacterium]|nr:uracil-xanthine permease [Clostridia bacterium]